MGYKRKKQAEFDDYTDVSFKEKFGVHKVVAKQLLEDIKFTEQHWLMWTLDFLRNYNSFNYSSAHFGVCDKNFREKVWMVIDSIKQLSIKHRTLSKTKFDKDKESLPDHAADHPEATIALAVDSTFCDLETKDNGFYNGEKKRFGVKAEWRGQSYDTITELGPEPFITHVTASTKPEELLATCLAKLKDNQDKIKQCANDFYKLEAEYLKVIDSEVPLMFKESRELISRITDDSFVKIALCGATCAGKSTLLSLLLDRLPLPSGKGHTTARICIIRYAELKDAKISLCRLNQATSKLEPIPNGEAASLAQYKTTRELKPVLDKFLRRENFPNEKFEEIVTQIVLIQYPIKLLKGGVEIYDIPGYSSEDKDCLRELRQSFLKHVNPHGLIFCFPNPAFSTEEINAYDDLLKGMGTDVELRTTSRTFFANTKFEMFSFAYDQGLTLEELEDQPDKVQEEEKKRSENLPKRSQHLSEENKNVALEGYTYALVNAVEYLEGGGQLIFHRFLERLSTWIVGQQQRRYATAYMRIAQASSSFFSSYNTIRSNTIDKILKEEWLNNGNAFLDQLGDDLREQLTQYLLKIDDHFQVFMDRNNLYTEALKEAKSIKIQEYDGRSRLYSGEASGAFKEAFSPWFNKNVLEAFSNHLQGVIDGAIQQTLKNIFGRGDVFENELLNDVLKQSFVAGFKSKISNDKILYNRITPTIITNMFMTASDHPVLATLSVIMGVGIIATVFGLIAAPFIDSFRKIDDDFKEKLTKRLFVEIKSQVKDLPNKLFVEQVASTQKVIESLKGNLVVRQNQMTKMSQKLKNMREMAETRTNFGKVEAEALSALTSLMDPSYKPVVSLEDIGGGATGRVYKGTLEGKPVAVKTLVYADPNGEAFEMAESMFFEEVNNSHQLTANITNLKYLLPLLGVFKDEVRKEWQIVYPLYDCDLFTYIKRSIPHLSFKQSLNIAIDMASCIVILHQNKIIHRDLKLENFFINYNRQTEEITQIALGDYGTITFTNIATTLVGTIHYIAPEIKRGDTYTEKVDIYAFSGLLFELLAKPTFQRANIESFKNAAPMKGVPEEYQQLLVECSDVDPNKRPTIDQAKQRLVELARKH
ncbi:hypothetical protein SAMD00019534_048970 [Acytostelium subglobosum LB1]|uniref:hypothetical protein n=1 Tax=Acytostelium subglobosum LB1 TaxID=1410327 RepID=UPI000644CCBF|nr:hypothetical protein SAMD00019534_048970 [Acytostelium subglobosum LB1]GAM21722.1 hypothetical protein SAMD00019534_048970 [Acytostelium subglobosum LB1]|eukprot:XP_012754822.1 hypothetical protein SAMD00019534_048970 [Acytostelium subglobosum LB1]